MKMQNRDKLLLKNSIINYGVRFAIYLCNFLSVPLSLQFLGKEKFGVFQTILTFISWAYLANLGIGNGLRNKISEYLALDKLYAIKKIIGTALFLSFFIALFLFIIGNSFLYYIFQPTWLFKDLSISADEVKYTFIISFSFFCLQLFLSLFSSIAYGIHKSYLATTVQFVHLLAFCSFVFILIKTNTHFLMVYIAIAYGIAMILGQLFPLISISRNKDIWPPSLKDKKIYYKELFSKSIGFFILQLSAITLFSTDNFIISKLLGANEVTEYSIVNKIYFIIITVFSILLIQVWNSTTDAIVKKDVLWIKNTVKKLQLLLIPLFIISLIIGLVFNNFTVLWLKQNYNLSIYLRISFAIYTVIHCINSIYVNILNGAGRLKLQTFAYITATFFNILLSYYFIKNMNMSIEGVIFSKIICVTFTSIICIIDYKKLFKSLER